MIIFVNSVIERVFVNYDSAECIVIDIKIVGKANYVKKIAECERNENGEWLEVQYGVN